MKINKFNFLKIVAKHISKKLGNDSTTPAELTMLASSLIPLFGSYFVKLKESGCIDSNDFILIEPLEEQANKFFTVVPILNFPMGNSTISIHFSDIKAFFKDVKEACIIDEIIYLPCQKSK